jgi:hypothetical protein
VVRELVTSVQIAASRAQVWQVLADLESWPEWNPSIEAFSGVAVKGTRLRFRARSTEGGGAVTLRPIVLSADSNRLLRWSGSFLIPGLFDAVHGFELTEQAGGTLVTQRERISGVLVPLMSGLLKRTERDNRRADEALRSRVQAEVGVPSGD